jgi:hypothetical protein
MNYTQRVFCSHKADFTKLSCIVQETDGWKVTALGADSAQMKQQPQPGESQLRTNTLSVNKESNAEGLPRGS